MTRMVTTTTTRLLASMHQLCINFDLSISKVNNRTAGQHDYRTIGQQDDKLIGRLDRMTRQKDYRLPHYLRTGQQDYKRTGSLSSHLILGQRAAEEGRNRQVQEEKEEEKEEGEEEEGEGEEKSRKSVRWSAVPSAP